MIFAPLPGIPLITQWFGVNVQRYKKYDLKGHNGLDFRAPLNTPCYAPHEGFISYGNNGKAGYGKYLTIRSLPYKEGVCRESTLGHLSRYTTLPEGSFVAAGDLVGFSGNTGDSTAPHLHWTYKLTTPTGAIIGEDNGFHGALDVSPYTQLWELGHLLRS